MRQLWTIILRRPVTVLYFILVMDLLLLVTILQFLFIVLLVLLPSCLIYWQLMGKENNVGPLRTAVGKENTRGYMERVVHLFAGWRRFAPGTPLV